MAFRRTPKPSVRRALEDIMTTTRNTDSACLLPSPHTLLTAKWTFQLNRPICGCSFLALLTLIMTIHPLYTILPLRCGDVLDKWNTVLI